MAFIKSFQMIIPINFINSQDINNISVLLKNNIQHLNIIEHQKIIQIYYLLIHLRTV